MIPHMLKVPIKSDRCGSPEAYRERSYKGDKQRPGKPPEPSVSETQERCFNDTGIQPEKVEPVHSVSALPDGRDVSGSTCRPVEKGRLADENRPEGNLFCSTNSRGRS